MSCVSDKTLNSLYAMLIPWTGKGMNAPAVCSQTHTLALSMEIHANEGPWIYTNYLWIRRALQTILSKWI